MKNHHPQINQVKIQVKEAVPNYSRQLSHKVNHKHHNQILKKKKKTKVKKILKNNKIHKIIFLLL